jgi:hypothetical protein
VKATANCSANAVRATEWGKNEKAVGKIGAYTPGVFMFYLRLKNGSA